MPRNSDDLSLHEAGRRINDSGLTDKVDRLDADDLGQNLRERRKAPASNDDRDDTVDEDPDEIDSDDDAEDDDLDPDEDDESDRPGDDDDGDDSDDGDESDEDEDPANSSDAKYTVKVNGKTSKVTLKELTAGYQRGEDYQQKTTAINGFRRDLETKHREVAQDYHRRLAITTSVVGRVRDILVGDVNSAAMQDLRVKDPQQWSVVRQTLADRIEQVNGLLGNLHQEYERHAQTFQQRQQNHLAAAAPNEEASVTRHITDWGSGGKERLANYLTTSGFSAEEIAGVVDHRMWLIAEKARKYDAQQRALQKAQKKKAKKAAPKHAPAKGSGLQRQASKETRRSRGFREARDQARKSGNMRDAGRAINYLLDK